MTRKIIFLDIDGTLTTAGTNVPPESALQAIWTAQDKGHLVFLCTGRSYEMMRPLLSYGFDGVVASSGGYIYCDNRVIYDCPMTKEQQQIVMRTQYGIVNGDVMSGQFDKGRALVRVCEYLHIPLENSIAFGDSMNDKEMMETAGYSICMENGSDTLKKLADEICPRVERDGLYQGFLRLGLI